MIKFTPEEKEYAKKLILEKRAKDDLDKVKKIGFAKKDIYYLQVIVYEFNNYYYDSDEKNEAVKKFEHCFRLACPAGTKFECYINENGYELWYDTVNFGIENGPDWAREYLEGIIDV